MVEPSFGLGNKFFQDWFVTAKGKHGAAKKKRKAGERAVSRNFYFEQPPHAEIPMKQSPRDKLVDIDQPKAQSVSKPPGFIGPQFLGVAGVRGSKNYGYNLPEASNGPSKRPHFEVKLPKTLTSLGL